MSEALGVLRVGGVVFDFVVAIADFQVLARGATGFGCGCEVTFAWPRVLGTGFGADALPVFCQVAVLAFGAILFEATLASFISGFESHRLVAFV